jgi:hypothetical protein
MGDFEISVDNGAVLLGSAQCASRRRVSRIIVPIESSVSFSGTRQGRLSLALVGGCQEIPQLRIAMRLTFFHDGWRSFEWHRLRSDSGFRRIDFGWKHPT